MAANAKSASEKFELFRAEYLAHGNAYRAALAAGYSKRMAKSKSWKLAKRARTLADKTSPVTQAKIPTVGQTGQLLASRDQPRRVQFARHHWPVWRRRLWRLP